MKDNVFYVISQKTTVNKEIYRESNDDDDEKFIDKDDYYPL